MWDKAELDQVLTREEFEAKYMSHLRAWMSKEPRQLGAWLYMVNRWAEGDH